MNSETGLPHTEFYQTTKEFSPRRLVPISGLSKKYMGLESISKSEMGSLTEQSSAQQDNTQSNSNTPNNRQKNWNSFVRRITGGKRMSKADMQHMIARFTNKTPESKKNRQTAEWTERGVTAGYTWQGKRYLRNATDSSDSD